MGWPKQPNPVWTLATRLSRRGFLPFFFPHPSLLRPPPQDSSPSSSVSLCITSTYSPTGSLWPRTTSPENPPRGPLCGPYSTPPTGPTPSIPSRKGPQECPSLALCQGKSKKGIIRQGFLPPQPSLSRAAEQAVRHPEGPENAPVYAPPRGTPFLGHSPPLIGISNGEDDLEREEKNLSREPWKGDTPAREP